MQKHEREVISMAKEILEPAGFKVAIERSGPKLVIRATKPGCSVAKKISSSPKSVMAEVGFTRRWAREVVSNAI